MSATQSTNKVVLITGTSSGIGKALAIQLATKYPDFIVYATLRSPDSDKGLELKKDTAHLTNVRVAQLEVTSEESVQQLKEKILSEQGRLDILINNAGIYVEGAQDSYTVEDAKKQFETNLFGVIRVQNAFFPTFRKQRSGHLIGVSSVLGSVGSPFGEVYVASKFALEGLYESQSPVNQQFGIQTTLIQPGPVITEVFANATRTQFSPELQELHGKFEAKVKEQFVPPFLQTTDEALVVFFQAIEDGLNNKASVRYQTSEGGKQLVATQLKDLDGNAGRDSAIQTYFK